MKAVHEPVLRNYQEALGDVDAARRNVIATAEKLQAAEASLSALEEASGVRDPLAMAAARDALTVAQNGTREAVENLRQAQSDLATSEKILHASNNELAEDAKALDVLYKNSLTGSLKGYGDSLDGVRNAKDLVTSASARLREAEDSLRAAMDSGNASDTQNADRKEQEAREGLRLATNELSTAEQFLQSKYGVSKAMIDILTNDTGVYSKAVQAAAAALSGLGITSAVVLQKMADDSKTKYDAIAASGTASANQQREAQIRSLEDQQAAFIALGKDLPEEQQKTLDHLLADQEYFNRRHRDQWIALYHQIDGIVTNLSGDLVRDLFESPSSFGKTALKALQSIGEAVVTSFVKPATDAIAKFIGITIADLLSGRGLGGILKNVKDIGTAFGSLFGKVAATTPTTLPGGSIPGLSKIGGIFTGAAGSGEVAKQGGGLPGGIPGDFGGEVTGAGSSAASSAAGSLSVSRVAPSAP